MKDNYKEGFKVFNRADLRTVCMFKGEDGTFAVVVRILDPVTLTTEMIINRYMESTLEIIIALYLQHFSD